MTSRVSFLEGLLLILQVVVMAGLSVVSGPQLINGEVTPETFTDFCVHHHVARGIKAVVVFRCWRTGGW